MNVSDTFWAPKKTHEKCDVSELNDMLDCRMSDLVLECSKTSCGGQKFTCDCNVYDEWWASDCVRLIFWFLGREFVFSMRLNVNGYYSTKSLAQWMSSRRHQQLHILQQRQHHKQFLQVSRQHRQNHLKQLIMTMTVKL